MSEITDDVAALESSGDWTSYDLAEAAQILDAPETPNVDAVWEVTELLDPIARRGVYEIIYGDAAGPALAVSEARSENPDG